MTPLRASLLACLAAGAATAVLPAASATAATKSAAGPRLPARLLTCSLGHASNFDPAQRQTLDDLTYDSHHRLSLFLPGIAERDTPPPDAIDPAELVDPKTRILEDPDRITADAPGPFNRVVDLWPERVELTKMTRLGAFKAFLVSDYDPARGTARLFMGTASDLTTYDLSRIYLGECSVTLNPANGAKSS